MDATWIDRPMQNGFVWSRLDLALASDPYHEGIAWVVALPCWLLAGIFAAPPAVWWMRRRGPKGRGFDVRAVGG